MAVFEILSLGLLWGDVRMVEESDSERSELLWSFGTQRTAVINYVIPGMRPPGPVVLYP